MFESGIIFKTIFATMGTSLVGLLGGWSLALKLLLLMIALDYITGLIHAIVNKKLSSEIGAKGISKKFGILIIITVAHILDLVLGLPAPILSTFAIYFYIANEGISLVENWGLMGLPMPDFIKNTLAQLKSKSNEGKDIEDKKNS